DVRRALRAERRRIVEQRQVRRRVHARVRYRRRGLAGPVDGRGYAAGLPLLYDLIVLVFPLRRLRPSATGHERRKQEEARHSPGHVSTDERSHGVCQCGFVSCDVRVSWPKTKRTRADRRKNAKTSRPPTAAIATPRAVTSSSSAR